MTESELFTEKFALLDVNILSEMSKPKRAKKFRPVFDLLKKYNVEIFIIDATKFEFTAFSTNEKDFERLANWLAQFTIAPTTPKDIELAARLSSMYKCRNPNISSKQISYPDCLYGAQLIKYKQRAFIVTTNFNDYPLFLFDIEKSMIIEEDNGQGVVVAFMFLNDKKLEDLQKSFEASG